MGCGNWSAGGGAGAVQWHAAPDGDAPDGDASADDCDASADDGDTAADDGSADDGDAAADDADGVLHDHDVVASLRTANGHVRDAAADAHVLSHRNASGTVSSDAHATSPSWYADWWLLVQGRANACMRLPG